MQKKEIEKTPFLKLPRLSRKKMAEYVAVTAIKEIREEPCLFVEVYRNRKGCREVPVARIAMTGKDFGTYFTSSGTWSRGKVTNNTWDSHGLIWTGDDGRTSKTRAALAEENILYSPDDLKRIQAFLDDITVRGGSVWWDYILQKQEDITRREKTSALERKRERRQQALRERMEATPELPEASILEYADRRIFQNRHYLYYKKTGRRAVVACSACGQVAEGKWKQGESYESQYRHTIQEPREGYFGTCPSCGAFGKFMPQGRVKGTHRDESHIFLGQEYRETGMVFRYVHVEKEYVLEECCGEKGLEMTGAGERLSLYEIARAYFEKGKKKQVDYQKHSYYDGAGFWDDCNLSGLANISVKEAVILPETYGNMQGTFLQYSALREYQEAVREVNPFEYMDRYIHTPQIEMLVKFGLTGVVGKLLRHEYGIVADENAKSVDGFLGIRKEKVKYFMKKQGDTELIRLLQMEKRLGQDWTEEQTDHLAEAAVKPAQCADALRYMTVQKLLNRIEKYAGCGFGTGCGHAMGRLRSTAQFYFDYLDLRQQLGYSLDNTVYQQPRDLTAAHDRMVYESNKKEQDKRMEEVAERFPLIRKHYRSLRKQYFYQDDTYLIRPARSAEEIVMEGRILHHCVGGDCYLENHDKGESIILLLRSREDPDIPYITVEMGKGFQIHQWYGAHDKKPDEKNMQGWLDAYVTRLKCGNMAAGMEDTAGLRIAVTA